MPPQRCIRLQHIVHRNTVTSGIDDAAARAANISTASKMSTLTSFYWGSARGNADVGRATC